MTDHDDPEHRAYHQPDPDRVHLRDLDESDDGTFAVRMPLASTGEVRNEGDDPLTRDEIDGMAQQVAERQIGVFLDHGRNMDIGGSRYSAVGKVGEWQSPELVENDAGDTLLEADARLMDPETLPAATGSVREALAALKSQVERDIGLSSSIGWRDDEDFAGGVDLMEASIVGIPADPRTTSQDAAVAMARAALDERSDDVDAEQLVADFRAVVMGPDEQRHLSSQQAEIAATLLDAYQSEQGNGSVENFESWLWNVAYHQFDDNEFHAAQTALREFFRETTPLEEPVGEQFAPFLEVRQDGDETSENNMGDTTTQSGDEPDGTNDDDQGSMDEQEYRESMLEMQRQQTETLSTLADAIREDGDDDDDDEEENEGDDEDDEDDDDGRALEVDGEEVTAADIRELREQAAAADPETSTDEDDDPDGTDSDSTSSSDPYNKYGIKPSN